MNLMMAVALLFIPWSVVEAKKTDLSKKDMHAYCVQNVEELLREAVAYHMTGAPTSTLPNNCAKKMKWKYFDPNIEVRNEPPKIMPTYTFFDPKKDTYKIRKTRKVKDEYEIDVDFNIGGKKISTTYYYRHRANLKAFQKVCGVVEHPDPPWIFRSDCKK